MVCEECGSRLPPVMGDDCHYCQDCGVRIETRDSQINTDYGMLASGEPLGSDFSPTNSDQKRQHFHQSQSNKKESEDWIKPILDVLRREVTREVASRAYELVRAANRVKALGKIRVKLKGIAGIGTSAERTAYRRDLWALSAVEALSEIENCDYGTDRLFSRYSIPSHDRNWAVKLLRPRRAHTSRGPDDIRRQVIRNTIERARQISQWLNASEGRLRGMFPPGPSTEVMEIARSILREEWGQPVYEGDYYGVHPYSNHPPRRVATRAVLEAMRQHPGFERKDRTAFWEAFPVKGISRDSIK